MSKWLKERGLSILDNALYEGVRLLIVALLLTVGYAVYRSIRQQPLQWIVLLVFVALGIIALSLIAVSRLRNKNRQSAPTSFRPGGALDGEIYRLVWAKDASAHARLFLEVQITNNGIPATVVRGYGAHAKLRDGTRLDGKTIAIPIGQQMVTGNYKITANKLIYEETTTPIIDGGQAGGVDRF